MSRTYYAYQYRLDHKDQCLLWHTDAEENEADGVVVDPAGKVPAFRTMHSLIAYAQERQLSMVQESVPAFVHLDAIIPWLRRKRTAQLDCGEFLAAWNLLADLSLSVDGNFDKDKRQTSRIYNKLFWGSNLPALTPKGKHYTPLWRHRESRILRRVLNRGLQLFRSHVAIQTEPAKVSCGQATN